jgi:D-alanyl-D-alanine carboxypeptidase
VPGAGYPLACGMRTGYLRAPDPAAVAGASFRALWRQAGGRLDGRVRAGPVPQGARLLADGASPPLAEVIRAINKHSNNVMARTLFLSLAQADGGATLDRATGRTPMGGDAPGTLDGTQDGAPEGPAEALVDALVDAVAEAPAGSPADTAAQASLKAPADAATQATAQGSAQVAAQVAAQASGDPGRDDAADLAVPAAAAPVPPWTGAAAERALRQWLLRIGVPAPGLVVRNGSGLSREERISARSLAALLVHAWAAPAMPDYLASLPQAGVDGTMAHRPVRAGAAWIKTGTLDGVRAVAGYVQAASGHRYAVVGLLNDPAAAGAQGALDALLRWVAEGG